MITISNALATTNSTLLQFGGFHDPALIFVDDVAVDLANAAVPEPVSLALVGLGLAGLGLSRRKQA